MAEVVDLVPKRALERSDADSGQKPRPKKGYRAVRLARLLTQAEPLTRVDPEDGPAEPAAKGARSETPGTVNEAKGDCVTGLPLAGDSEDVHRYKEEPGPAGRCFRVYSLEGRAVVLFWRSPEIGDEAAPDLGAGFKALLGRKRTRRVILDFSTVESMSTGAIAMLLRFRNLSEAIQIDLKLVAGPRLRELLRQAGVERTLEVVDCLGQLVGRELGLVESRGVRGERSRWRRFREWFQP